MEYRCNKCNKKYSSYQSLWIHNKKYHTIVKTANDCTKTLNDCVKTANTCKYCNKIFTRKNNMNVHIKKSCKEKQNKDRLIQEELDKVKNELAIIKKQKIININKGTINNTTNIIKFGKENIVKILDIKQIMDILNCRVLALEESIKTVHFNNMLPQYQNIRINNLRSNVAIVYDGETFNTMNQYNAINDLISNHVDGIIQLIEIHKEKLNEKTLIKLEKFIEMIDDNYKKIFDENKNYTFKNYKDFKISKIREIIYNESKKLNVHEYK